MYKETYIDEKDKRRLRFLIIFRAIIMTLFLGIAIYIDIKKQGSPVSSNITLYLLYSIITLTYIISVVYALLLKYIKDLRFNIYLQLTVDIILITFLVYFTGSFRSNYSLLYTLVIIYSVIFLGRRGGLIVASASCIFYGLLLDLEFYGWIPSISFVDHDYNVSTGDVQFVFWCTLSHFIL
jgi:two-component system, NtrC family, sensor histidine kinase PilS